MVRAGIGRAYGRVLGGSGYPLGRLAGGGPCQCCIVLWRRPLWPGPAGLYGGRGPHYGTGVGESAAAAAAGGVHGFPAVLTSFIGRAGPAREVAGLLEQHRLVTVTGPGGAGKTRLAGEVARGVAGRFADGAWLAELAPVQDAAQVPAVVAAALKVREQPGVPVAEVLVRVLARQQLLLVLDNCEHLIGAAAELCAGLPDHPCSGTRPAHPVLPANAGHPEDGVAPRAQAGTANPRSVNAARAGRCPGGRETKATRDRKMVRRAEHRDTGVSTNGNRVGSPGG